MKICIESQLLNHHQRSGLMTYAEGLINSLYSHDIQNDYELLYYSLRRNQKDMPGPSGKNFTKKVLKVPDQEFKGRQWILDHLILPQYFKKNRIQIFHRPSGYTMPATTGVFQVMTIHDLRTLTIKDNLWKQNIENYKKTINNLNICIVVSECTKKDLVEYLNVPDKKIKVIYLGADKRFQPSSPENIQRVRQKYQLNEQFLFSVGSVPRKNIDGIIRAFAESKIHDQFQLVLGCNLDQDKYWALAQELNIKHRIKILSKLNDQDVVALYSACQAFVFPSLYEGFGLPILEAMQCGAPVITSNLSSCPEVAGEAAILVDPAKIDEIAYAIDQICTNNTLRQNLIQKGFLRAKLFNWDKYAQEINKIYDQA